MISLPDSRQRSGKVCERVITNNSISLGGRHSSTEILFLSVNNHASMSFSFCTVKIPIIKDGHLSKGGNGKIANLSSGSVIVSI